MTTNNQVLKTMKLTVNTTWISWNFCKQKRYFRYNCIAAIQWGNTIPPWWMLPMPVQQTCHWTTIPIVSFMHTDIELFTKTHTAAINRPKRMFLSYDEIRQKKKWPCWNPSKVGITFAEEMWYLPHMHVYTSRQYLL
jgi:hypothetical protein